MTARKIEIQELPQSRWKACRDLRLEALREEPLAFGSSYEEEKNISDAEWQTRIKNALFALENDKLIGMVVLIQQTNIKSRHVANVFGLYVQSSHREKGIGKLLMSAAIEKLTAIGTIRKIKLAVNAELTATINLYEQFGFQRVGMLNQELRYNDRFYDELIMEKLIK
ncbi:MAG: GNAT family N-acetyltransferase [Cytophagales bacterium]|nr:GNAT family N-acetyltransferase [Cytophagales bacterium]